MPGPGEDGAELPAHQSRTQDADSHEVPPGQPRYWSSLTGSIHSAVLPSSCSWMAMCVMAVVGAAPCQCFSPGANETTSPGRISSIGPPQRWARPQPASTISDCPSG